MEDLHKFERGSWRRRARKRGKRNDYQIYISVAQPSPHMKDPLEVFNVFVFQALEFIELLQVRSTVSALRSSGCPKPDQLIFPPHLGRCPPQKLAWHLRNGAGAFAKPWSQPGSWPGTWPLSDFMIWGRCWRQLRLQLRMARDRKFG